MRSPFALVAVTLIILASNKLLRADFPVVYQSKGGIQQVVSGTLIDKIDAKIAVEVRPSVGLPEYYPLNIIHSLVLNGVDDFNGVLVITSDGKKGAIIQGSIEFVSGETRNKAKLKIRLENGSEVDPDRINTQAIYFLRPSPAKAKPPAAPPGAVPANPGAAGAQHSNGNATELVRESIIAELRDNRSRLDRIRVEFQAALRQPSSLGSPNDALLGCLAASRAAALQLAFERTARSIECERASQLLGNLASTNPQFDPYLPKDAITFRPYVKAVAPADPAANLWIGSLGGGGRSASSSDSRTNSATYSEPEKNTAEKSANSISDSESEKNGGKKLSGSDMIEKVAGLKHKSGEVRTLEFWAREAKVDFIPLHFAQAANFSIPEFGLCFEPLQKDGLVIYEGMRVTVTATGHFEVRMSVSAPKTPIVVRLQLYLRESSNPESPTITLTLPPIAIDPSRDGYPIDDPWRRYEAGVYNLRHVGYSPELSLRFGTFSSQSIIGRNGTARFGSLPPTT